MNTEDINAFNVRLKVENRLLKEILEQILNIELIPKLKLKWKQA